jgi:CPA2 family monovalent cation:H+ antiporter-2
MHASLLTDLSIVMVVAAATGLLARRVGQPSVLGYLFAGLIVGPYLPIPLFADPHRMEELAHVGVVLVLFAVGLEFRVKRLFQILPVSGTTALIQIGTLGWIGFLFASLIGWSASASVVLGSTLAISSTMVVSSVLRAQPVDDDIRAHVFGVLVVQDVAAIVLMAVVTALAAGQSVGPWALTLLLVQLLAVVAGMLATGMLVLPRLVRWVADDLDPDALIVLVGGTAFGMALVAELFHYSAALGAFIAGMVIAESGRQEVVEHAVEPLRAMFAALFFVSIGMAVDPVVALSTLPMALALVVVVVGFQLLSVAVGGLVSGLSLRRSLHAGLALGQIGELSFILATIAIGGGIVPAELLPTLVTVATVTAFTTPWLLQRAPQIVKAVDRRLPGRLHEALARYQSFLRGVQQAGDQRSFFVRPATAFVLDWLVLLMLAVVEVEVSDALDTRAGQVVTALVVCLAVPLFVGMFRSGVRLFRTFRGALEQRRVPAGFRPVIESTIVLAGVLALGTPTLAVIDPLLSWSWLELGFVAIAVGAGVVWFGRFRRLEESSPSGVVQLASGLARHAEDDDVDEESLDDPGLDGLDVEWIAVGRATAGHTLGELDVRVRTGATVVAIRRETGTALLPTGHDVIHVGDKLGVSAHPEALERARTLLTA